MRTELLNQRFWGAVLAGAIISLTAHLNMIGIGVGASTVDAAADNPVASTISIGTARWRTVSGIVAAFVGATPPASYWANRRTRSLTGTA